MLLANDVVAVQSLSRVWLFVIPWTAGSSISHSLLEFAQILVGWVGDTIQQPQPLLLSSFAFNLSQHQGLLSQWVGFSHQVAKVLKFQLPLSVLPMNSQGWFPLGLTGLISMQFKNSQESFPAPQLESSDSSALSFLYGLTLTSIYDYWKTIASTGKASLLAKWCLCLDLS